ncbi:MAG: ribonuclease J [Candidatus Portnoybacteria bacterium CG_4_10_14_0_2_um_filter_44_20]|uniref:Ribonuclease J n=6 Tax=Candidatus Portnoyibacteriota TaxID=1817913 RepID=A0A2H0KQK2_9BACT|nr:MAG: ribonuclease J [Candidatus Portnoybacteria bacterium CG11_big_fil_rev_8_21_14_0_20_44_10]PIZ70283.1 MAG: ribonuclease J [Candidatus Portnoybacteria bacterium CG_4_10_14_0_2_um_filter_44_20]
MITQQNTQEKQLSSIPRRSTHKFRGHAQNVLRVIPLGGVEEVGRNMTLFEYGNDIIIVDMGLQFPEEDMPGIDYIIPNISYLRGKEKNIRGIIITHGHYDHIGGIPHIVNRLGNPTVYTAELTRGIILKRQEDFKELPKLDIEIVKKNDTIELGSFKVTFFHVNHTIPDAMGLAIETPTGLVVHTGDFKFDHSPVADSPADLSRISQLAQKGVLLLMSESTDAETPGHSISEKTIQENLENIFKDAKGRIIAVTFSSLLTRIQSIIFLAEKYGRKVAIDGYSMKTNVEMAKALNYLKINKGTLISISQVNGLDPSKVVVMCTGAQGEDKAVLMRIANHEHRHIRIQKGDSVIFSSSVVPGNERTVQGLKDTLCRQGAKIFHSLLMDIHAGGHAPQEDLKMMINLTRPKFFMPIHGNYYMLKLHAELAESVGIPTKNIYIPSNGQVILLNKEKIWYSREKVPANYVMVDGLGVGDVGQVVLRDRQMMSQDGIFVIIATIDKQNGKVKSSPDIISRGFIYMRESKELLADVRNKVKEIVEESTMAGHPVNWSYVKDNLRDKIGQFLYTKTERRPMVIPVVIEV